MEEYKLELKQIVDYPRCRMYREFIQGLIANMNLRVGKESYLYYYTVLCCFANFRTSYHRVKGVTHILYPGEWLCRIEDMKKWFRAKSKKLVISIMEKLQEKKILKFKLVGKEDVIKYRIDHQKILLCMCRRKSEILFLQQHGGENMRKSEMPVGFAMALAMNPDAMQKFAAMNEVQKHEIIAEVHAVHSKDEMQRYVNSLANDEQR